MSRGVSFSELWQPGAGRDQILALEADIERGDIQAGVRRAAGLLQDTVAQSERAESVAEALLMLGVCGEHYARFRSIVTAEAHVPGDALFCLFFLTDIELRIRYTSAPPLEPLS